jgi:hypothetical protein
MLDGGAGGTIEELALREEVKRGYMSRVLRLMRVTRDPRDQRLVLATVLARPHRVDRGRTVSGS